MKTETHPVRMLYGSETRTSHATPQDIAAHWQRIQNENLADFEVRDPAKPEEVSVDVGIR